MGTKSGLGLDCECILDVGTQEVSAQPSTTGHFLLFWVAQTSLPQDDPFASSRYPSEETTKFTIYQGFATDLSSHSLQVCGFTWEKHQLGGCCNFNIPGLSWGNCPECLAVLLGYLGSRARSISTQANRKEDTLVLFFFCFLQACKLPKKLARCKYSPHTADLHGFMLCQVKTWMAFNGRKWILSPVRPAQLEATQLGPTGSWVVVKTGSCDDGCHESLVASRRRVKTRGSAEGCKVPSLFWCHWCATIKERK